MMNTMATQPTQLLPNFQKTLMFEDANFYIFLLTGSYHGRLIAVSECCTNVTDGDAGSAKVFPRFPKKAENLDFTVANRLRVLVSL